MKVDGGVPRRTGGEMEEYRAEQMASWRFAFAVDVYGKGVWPVILTTLVLMRI
jgi:hypothetical protein